MKQQLNWQKELNTYLIGQDREQAALARLWLAAIGLQGVDGLEPSDYLVHLAIRHIRRKLTLEDAEQKLTRYYKWHRHSQELSRETWEADLVSIHIVALLMDRRFEFSPRELKRIHHQLFQGVYSFAGNFRDYEIRKQEPVLKGESVRYLPCSQIRSALQLLFETDPQFFADRKITPQETRRFARFMARIWFVHPYGEGNTRSTAVFMLKYLSYLHIPVYMEDFAGAAWYFRNAMVRANYQSTEPRVVATTRYLELFLQNLLLGRDNLLVSRHLAIDYEG